MAAVNYLTVFVSVSLSALLSFLITDYQVSRQHSVEKLRSLEQWCDETLKLARSGMYMAVERDVQLEDNHPNQADFDWIDFQTKMRTQLASTPPEIEEIIEEEYDGMSLRMTGGYLAQVTQQLENPELLIKNSNNSPNQNSSGEGDPPIDQDTVDEFKQELYGELESCLQEEIINPIQRIRTKDLPNKYRPESRVARLRTIFQINSDR